MNDCNFKYGYAHSFGENPCKGCADRKCGCHDECGKYAKWRLGADRKTEMAKRKREYVRIPA